MLDYFYGGQADLFSFYRLPKALFVDPRFRGISAEAKILYGLLLDRMGLSVKNGWMDDTGKVYIIFTTEEIMEALCCADNKATKLMKELEGCGLIERKRRGLGKPSLTYVKNFISEPSEPRIQSRENHDSGTVKNATAESLKSRGIKNNQNNTDLSDTDPFLSDVAAGTESEGKDDRTRYQELILSFRTWPPERNPKGKMTAPGIRNIFSGSLRLTLLLQAAPTMKICCAKYWSCWWTLCAANAASSASRATISPPRL